MKAGLYAVTDGLHAQYFNHYDGVDSVVTPNVWPIPIDVRYGVAAVTHATEQRDGSTASTTTSMLGCRCLDDNGRPPMRIQCALALKDPSFGSSSSVFDVVFQQRSTADYMMCSMAQISVQSVRWPASRIVSDSGAMSGALERSIVDATVWVSPLCTSRASKVPEVCTPLFKAAACYPYCMAARLQGSSPWEGLVLYNANEWRDRVHLMHRDCGVAPGLDDPVQLAKQQMASYLSNGADGSSDLRKTVEAVVPASPVPGSSVVAKKLVGCMQMSMARSMVGKDLLPSTTNVFRSILLKGQPFAYAGDSPPFFLNVCVHAEND